jgi:hypothetical protein
VRATMMETVLIEARSKAAALPARWLTRADGYVAIIAVMFAAAWIAGGALSKSELIGRLADPMTHNDVNYVIDGIRRLVYMEINGFWAEIPHLFQEPMHAPLSGYQAALGYYLFGFHDWAPYASNVVYLLIFLGVCAALLRRCPSAIVVAGLAAIAGMPLAYSTISEFAPEIPCGLFTALGVLLTLRIEMLDRATGPRALAGLCFGLGLLGKPTSFVFVPLVACATLGVVFVRDVILPGKLRDIGKAILHGVLHLALSLWLPAIYIVPNFDSYSDYFRRALFDAENVKAFGQNREVLYYLTGGGAEYMFGNLLWGYAATIAIGVAAAAKRGDRQFIGRQIELLLLAVFIWLPPTISVAKNTLFGAPFGYLVGFMVVMALRSIYETIRGTAGVAAVLVLGFLLMVSVTSRTVLPNTPGFDWSVPGAHITREKWLEEMERVRAVMLGNSPNYHGRTVYSTNSGYAWGPVLQYWFLKADPTLDWSFASNWADSDAQHHLDYIHHSKSDFVMAGERDNGLTYGPSQVPGASASENAVLAALREDQDYMPIDQFYGPTGRTITVFQRRVAYGGWRPLAGLINPEGTKQPWFSAGAVTHLQAYAAGAVPAELAIDVTGPPGETIDVMVNGDRIGRVALDPDGNGSLAQSFNLVQGQNDILLRYSADAPVTFKRLLVIRRIDRED